MKEPSYYQLDPEKVLVTITHLWNRIDQRFPESGLKNVCSELVKIGEKARERSIWIGQPQWGLRILTGLVILGLFALLILPFFFIDIPEGEKMHWKDFIQVLEAGLNDLLLIAAAIFFLVSIERRVKRSRALAAIHELRNLAHVIDMHQLTKDPDRIGRRQQDNTGASPTVDLTPFELRRYLDYCSEMLSLTGKIASMYLNKFEDSAAVAAVNEVENLTTGLSRKIWQKIMISQSLSQGNS